MHVVQVCVCLKDLCACFLAAHDGHIQVQDDEIVHGLISQRYHLTVIINRLVLALCLRTLAALDLELSSLMFDELAHISLEFLDSLVAVVTAERDYVHSKEDALHMVLQHAQLNVLVVDKHDLDAWTVSHAYLLLAAGQMAFVLEARDRKV